MKHVSKFALAALLASAISIPAYAESSGPSGGGSTASGNANVGGANTTGANVGVKAGAGTGTGSNVGASARVSGDATTNTTRTYPDSLKGSSPSDSLNSAETNARVNGDLSARGIGNTIGSTTNNTLGAGGTAAVGATGRVNETIGQRMARNRVDSDLFVTSDADASGTLNYDEYVAYSGTTTAQADIQTSFSKLDTDNNGFLTDAEIRARGKGESGTRSTQ